jgi:MFS family permease
MVKQIFRALRHKNYAMYFVGCGTSQIGNWMQRIATEWLVYRLTDSVVYLGGISFVNQVATSFLVPFTGVLADTWKLQRILKVTQFLAMLQSIAMFLLVASGTIQVWHIFVLGFCSGVINAFEQPARQSFVVYMVDDERDLGNAIALNSSLLNSARLIGPSIAGMLIAGFGESICFLLNAIGYLASLTALLLMKIQKEQKLLEQGALWQGLKEGVRFAVTSPPIRDILLLLTLLSFMGMPYTILMSVFAKDVLHGNSQTMGLLMSSVGLGALIGSFWLASRSHAQGLEKWLFIASSIFGLGLIAFSGSTYLPLSMALLAITAFGMIVNNSACNTMLQSLVDDEKRGRIMSMYTLAFMGTTPFGNLFAGFLANNIGVQSTLLIGGLVCVIGSLIFGSRLGKMRIALNDMYQAITSNNNR